MAPEFPEWFGIYPCHAGGFCFCRLPPLEESSTAVGLEHALAGLKRTP